MEASDSSITNGGPKSELVIIESKTLLVEQEEILSSELTSSDCDTPPSELNNTLTSLTPDPDLSNTDCDYRTGVKDSEDPSCSSCLDSSSCFTDESLDEASPQKRSKKLSGFSSQHWHMSRCFDRYWKHYYQSMAWCQRHFYIMRSMSNFMNYTGHYQNMNSSRCTTPSVARGQQFRFSPCQGRGRGRSRGIVRRGACQQNPGAGRQKGQSRASRVVDPDSHGGGESDDSEVYEMELTEEMVQFFAHSEEHRKQRGEHQQTMESRVHTSCSIIILFFIFLNFMCQT